MEFEVEILGFFYSFRGEFFVVTCVVFMAFKDFTFSAFDQKKTV